MHYDLRVIGNVHYFILLCFSKIFYTHLSLGPFNKSFAVLLNLSNEVLVLDIVFFNRRICFFMDSNL